MNDPSYDHKVDIFSIGVIVHILILKRPVFHGKNSADIFDQNKECTINFNQNLYKKLNETALEFIQNLLQKNPKYRFDATEALSHSYMLENKFNINNQFLKSNDGQFFNFYEDNQSYNKMGEFFKTTSHIRMS